MTVLDPFFNRFRLASNSLLAIGRISIWMGSTVLFRGTFAATFIVGLLLTAGIIGPKFISRGSVNSITNPADFRAFYCGGRAVAAGADPWRVEPIRSCEKKAAEAMGLEQAPDFVNPAPLPPFALLCFALLSLLPFASAVCVWFGILGIAAISTALGLAYLSKLPFLWIAITIALVNLLPVFGSQLSPVIGLLLVCSVLLISLHRYSSASIVLGLSTIEPHLTIPAIFGAFLLVPKMRFPLICSLSVVLAVSAFAVGIDRCIEYVAVVLPLHSKTEVHAIHLQYSLTTALAYRGFNDIWAVRLGSIQYAAMTLTGLVLARRVYETSGLLWPSIFVPVGCAMLGGVYLHLYQLNVVVIAALAILGIGAKTARPFALCAIVGILISMMCDLVLGLGSEGPTGSNLARHLHALRPDEFASQAARYWHDAHNSADPKMVALILCIKMPAIIGIIAFITSAALAGNSRAKDTEKSPRCRDKAILT